MVRKLFSRPRSKTAGAVSISRPVLHNVDTFRPDLLPIHNVTTDISAGHDHQNQKHEHAQSRQSKTLNRPRLHRQHTDDQKQQPSPLPCNPFTKRSEVLPPPSSSNKRLHKHHRTVHQASSQTSTPASKLQTHAQNSNHTPQPHSSSHAGSRSNSEHRPEKNERHDMPETNSTQPTLKRRPSKWKKMGSLLKSKDHRDAPPLPSGGYQLRINDTSRNAKSRDDNPVIPKTPQTAREKTFNSGLSPMASPAPKLSLDMPDFHMDRYSVMFDRVLPTSPEMSSPDTPKTPSSLREPSALLSRRDKKLQGLNIRSSSRSYNSDHLLQVHGRPSAPENQHGPPQPTRGRTLNVPRTSTFAGPGRSPLRRSATAPVSPSKDGQFLSVTKDGTNAGSPSSSVSNLSALGHRRRSLDSIASPGLLDTDTSDEDDDFVDADDNGDAIVIHAKVPTWEDPNEPKWEIINPRRKTVKPVLKQDSLLRGREDSRNSSRTSSPETPRPSTASAAVRRFGISDCPSAAAAALTGASGSVDDTAIMQRSSKELGKEPGKSLGLTASHPAVSRISREIPPIPIRSPARSSTTSTTSCYHSAQTSPATAARKSSLSTHVIEDASLPPPAVPLSGQSQHTPHIPCTLSSSVACEAHTDGEEHFDTEGPRVVEVSVARSVSVSRKTRPAAPRKANGVLFSGKGQLVRSRSKSAGPGRPATRG